MRDEMLREAKPAVEQLVEGKEEGVELGDVVQFLIKERGFTKRDAQAALRIFLEEGPLDLGPKLRAVKAAD